MGVFVIRKKHMGAAAPMTRLQRLNAPETTSRPEPHPSAHCPQPARSYARASSQVRRAVAAKPSLADLAGVQPSDSEEPINRGRRDKPRIIFQPIHAVIAMLTLTCALCASLTMLIQQATHYAQLQSTQPRYGKPHILHPARRRRHPPHPHSRIRHNPNRPIPIPLPTFLTSIPQAWRNCRR